MPSTQKPATQAPPGLPPKTMHIVHRFTAMMMAIDRRLPPSGCRTTQTGAERRQRMVNGKGVAGQAGLRGLLGVKPYLPLSGACQVGEQDGSQGRSADA